MQGRSLKVAVFAGAAALAGGVATGVASQGDADAATTQAAVAQRAGDPPGPPGARDLSALADALGVSTAKLRDALEAARPDGGPGAQPPAGRGEDPMAAALAEQLGLSTAKVEAALEAVRPAGAPCGPPRDGATPPDGSTPPGQAQPPGDAAPSDGATPETSTGSTDAATLA